MSAKWYPIEAGCKLVEGPAKLTFKHSSGVKFNVEHNYFFSDVVSFDTLNGAAIIPEQKTFTLDYPLEDKSMIRSDVPFFFADVNFDGRKELVLVSLCKTQRSRDSIAVFAINKQFNLVDSTYQITHKARYKYFDSQTKFNKQTKTVTVSFSGSAVDYEEWHYQHNSQKKELERVNNPVSN